MCVRMLIKMTNTAHCRMRTLLFRVLTKYNSKRCQLIQVIFMNYN